jgi:hypothetical protein
MSFRHRLLVAVCAGSCAAACNAATDSPIGSLSADARVAAGRVVSTGDHHDRPFAVVDKKAARIHVFDRRGRLVGESPILIGLSPGDAPSPKMGSRAVASLTPAERTTPAGRFASTPGRNDKGEAIVWFDYDAALAIHRLRPGPGADRRRTRIASPVASEHRVSFGCVVVPVAFYASVIAPTLGATPGFVYVLPELRPTGSFLDDLSPDARPD